MTRTLWLLTLIPLLLTGCAAPTAPAPTAAPSPRPPTATLTPAPAATPTITPTPTPDPAVLAFMAGLEDLSAPWGVVETERGAEYLVPVDGVEGVELKQAEVVDGDFWQVEGNELFYGEGDEAVKVGVFGYDEAGNKVLIIEEEEGERVVPLERLSWDVLKVVAEWQADGLHVGRQEALAALVERDEAGYARQVLVEGEWLEVPRGPLRDLVERNGKVSIKDIVAATPEDWRDLPEVDWRVWGYWVEENNAMMEALIKKMGYEAENFKQAMIMLSRWAKLWGTPWETYPFWTASAWDENHMFVMGPWGAVRLVVEGKELVVMPIPAVIDARQEDGTLAKRLVVFNLTFDPEVLAKVAEGDEGAMTMEALWEAVREGRQVTLGVMGGALLPPRPGEEEADRRIKEDIRAMGAEELFMLAAVNNGEVGLCWQNLEVGEMDCAEPQYAEQLYGFKLGVLVTKTSRRALLSDDWGVFNKVLIPVVGAGR